MGAACVWTVCVHYLSMATETNPTARTRTITARTITDAMIRALSDEACSAGDDEQVTICDRALARRGGRGECANVINACAERRGHYMSTFAW